MRALREAWGSIWEGVAYGNSVKHTWICLSIYGIDATVCDPSNTYAQETIELYKEANIEINIWIYSEYELLGVSEIFSCFNQLIYGKTPELIEQIICKYFFFIFLKMLYVYHINIETTAKPMRKIKIFKYIFKIFVM